MAADDVTAPRPERRRSPCGGPPSGPQEPRPMRADVRSPHRGQDGTNRAQDRDEVHATELREEVTPAQGVDHLRLAARRQEHSFPAPTPDPCPEACSSPEVPLDSVRTLVGARCRQCRAELRPGSRATFCSGKSRAAWHQHRHEAERAARELDLHAQRPTRRLPTSGAGGPGRARRGSTAGRDRPGAARWWARDLRREGARADSPAVALAAGR